MLTQKHVGLHLAIALTVERCFGIEEKVNEGGDGECGRRKELEGDD